MEFDTEAFAKAIATIDVQVKKLLDFIKSDDEGHWITINGAHVMIDGDGKIEKGPEEMVGKKPDEVGGRGEGESTRSGAENGFSKADEAWKSKLSDGQKQAVSKYLADWDEIRGADRKGKDDPVLNDFVSAVKSAPLVGGEVHRGFTVRTDEEMKQFVKGGTFKLNAVSSFSEDVNVAKSFAASSAVDYKRPFVTMTVSNPRSAHSIKGAGKGEDYEQSSLKDKEAICLKGTRYKVLSVKEGELTETRREYGSKRTYKVKGVHVVVEEI